MLLPPEQVEPVRGVFERLRAGDFPNTYENEWVTRAGERRLIAWSNTAMVDEAGRVTHVIGTGIDITRRKRAEDDLRAAHDRLEEAHRRLREEQAKLVQAEKLSWIGILASCVAHEVNYPRGGVMACLRALEQERVPAERRGEYFAAAHDGLERIQATVRDLLDYARQRAPVRETVDVAELAAACVRLVGPTGQAKRARVETRVRPGQVSVQADRSQIMQVLVNLLLNALYAVPEGGAVRVDAIANDGRVTLSVADDGPGIPLEMVARVCDPFFTTKPEGHGTGLGLAVVQGLVRAHGGELRIDSEVGRGTVVSVVLPAPDEGGATSR
jgi:signal transduction histidine kinase